MLPIPGTYHPEKDSVLYDWLGDAISGEVLVIEPDRVHIRITFEPMQEWETHPHTIIVVCEHHRVELG